MREFVQTIVIFLPGVEYPASVLTGLSPFLFDPVDPADPLQMSWRRTNDDFYTDVCTTVRNLGFMVKSNP